MITLLTLSIFLTVPPFSLQNSFFFEKLKTSREARFYMTFRNSFLSIKGDFFLYKVRTKLHIKIT